MTKDEYMRAIDDAKDDEALFVTAMWQEYQSGQLTAHEFCYRMGEKFKETEGKAREAFAKYTG